MSETFGDKLKQIRIERGLSQEDIAKILGTSKQVISRYEKNQRTPKITVALEYIRKLNISMDYFFKEEKLLTNRVAEELETYIAANSIVIRKLISEAQGLSKEEIKSLIALIKTMKNKK